MTNWVANLISIRLRSQTRGRSLNRAIVFFVLFVLASVATLSLSLSSGANFSIAQPLPPLRKYPVPALIQQAIRSLPAPAQTSADYFDQIQMTHVGALLWSNFPVTVAIDPQGNDRWQQAVRSAVADWQPYFSLQIVEVSGPDEFESVSKQVNIAIRATRFKLTRPPGSRELPRFRAAEARYSIQFNTQSNQLQHQMTIALAPGQADGVLRSAARHELGHAIGLWGHSQDPSDVMYFEQVKTPPKISDRDLRTLHRVYEQQTRLGS